MYRTPPTPRPYVVSAFNGEVVAYARATGQTLWHWRAQGSYARTRVQPTHVQMEGSRVFVLVAVYDDVGVLSGQTVSAQLNALDDSTGRVLWTHTLTRGQRFPNFAATLIVDAGQVLFSHLDVIMAIAAESGQVQWSRARERDHSDSFLTAIQLAVSGTTSRPSTW